jgi:hypothetical protein
MLRTTKNMKDKYEKIQSLIFSLIPEKWEEIYLYASVVGNINSMQTGELFFYYLPKGILKKKPINVYEVPHRFNINEEQYLEVVEKLYNCIKELKQDFIDTEQDLWTSLTISIANFKFKVEFNYDNLPINEQESQERHVIWRYKYLKIGGEKKEERRILDNYFSNKKNNSRKEIYETGLYLKTENNVVTFDKEDNVKAPKEVVLYEKEENNNMLEPKPNTDLADFDDHNPNNGNSKNQILNM